MTDENRKTKMAAVTGSSRMIPVEEALKMVLNASQQLPTIKISIRDALRKILAEGVKVFDPLPPYPASIKVKALEELSEHWRRLKLAWFYKELPGHKPSTMICVLNAQRKLSIVCRFKKMKRAWGQNLLPGIQ